MHPALQLHAYMRQLTIRNVSDQLVKRLEEASARGGARSLDNETVLERFLTEPFVSTVDVDSETNISPS